MNSISVFLADSQYLTRKGLINFLDGQNGFRIVGEASGESADWAQKLEKSPADLFIIDYLVNQKLEETVNDLIKSCKHQRTLIISDDQDARRIRSIVGGGVSGYLTKSCDEEEILEAISAVSGGSRFFCNKVLDIILKRERDDCSPTQLSARELEIVQLITNGHTTLQIAEMLHVSVHTINTHRKNILKKLEMKSPAQLIVYAIETGLVKTNH